MTLVASGIKAFGKLPGISAAASPLMREVTIAEVDNVAALFLSDQASGMTGQISQVDWRCQPNRSGRGGNSHFITKLACSPYIASASSYQ